MSDLKYTIDKVKVWFHPLEVLDNKGVTNHLTSLTKYGDNLVKSPNEKSETAWTNIFGECLSDVKVIPDDGALEFVKKYRTKFQANCKLSDDELNKMTKKEFVYLFAIVMPDIFNEEEKEEKEEEEKKRQLEHQKEYERRKTDPEYGDNTYTKNSIGGSKNKSRKRSTQKPRRSRRHRRRTTTRKYKK